MKAWRKIKKQEDESGKIVRVGRRHKYQMQMFEMLSKRSVRTYPLLQDLLKQAGVIKEETNESV